MAGEEALSEGLKWEHFRREGKYHLHVGWDDRKQMWLAIISKLDSEKKWVTMCSIGEHETRVEADKWFREQLSHKPWDESKSVLLRSVKVGFST